jgi:hypothetical protein
MRYAFYTVVCCSLLFGACKKNEIDKPEFTVLTKSDTYKLGDTVVFNFSGNPDHITFFSGENGNNYIYKNRTKAEGTPQLQFTSFMQNGTQQNTLQLLASSDFNGTVDSTNVYNATWTDITSRATLSTGSDNTPSGIVDITDLAVKDKPIYLAFKYVGFQSATSAQRTWTIKNFILNNLLPDGNIVPLAGMVDASWIGLSIKNIAAKWSITATQLQMAGGNINTPDNEDWIITKAIDLTKVAPDVGVPLKDMTTRLNGYSYIFKKPGTYKVTFVAANMNVKSQKSVVRELNITITP